MMTTVDIPDDLFRQAKSRAALEGVPLRTLVEKGLTMVLSLPSVSAGSRRVEFPLVKSQTPGVLTAQDVCRAEEELQFAEDLRHVSPL